jgi:hypothetical protein
MSRATKTATAIDVPVGSILLHVANRHGQPPPDTACK